MEEMTGRGGTMFSNTVFKTNVIDLFKLSATALYFRTNMFMGAEDKNPFEVRKHQAITIKIIDKNLMVPKNQNWTHLELESVKNVWIQSFLAKIEADDYQKAMKWLVEDWDICKK
ncbi:hypothetical protein RF11_11691 [Thelohanellus kitauei]|uniref:Uncharacterized protein n=1 Tax=Thelohanellus kitauei TaxID=669202 RepID=A0A0C2M5K4_THEKT|nr:hypothetical protein RF11_11691 [Thelohanellus kitauei]